MWSQSPAVDNHALLLGSSDRYFTTASRFVFSSGNHGLYAALNLTNVSDMILSGNRDGSSASIHLGRNGTILCNNVSRFRIEQLTFVVRQDHYKYMAVLHLLDSSQITVSSSVFLGSGNDTLAEVRSVYSWHSNISILNCHFEGNTGHFGGALLARVDSTVTISGSTFTKNRSQQSGGAIYVHRSAVTLDGVPGNLFLHKQRMMTVEPWAVKNAQ